VRERRNGAMTEYDLRAGSPGEFPMAADEIGVHVRLENIADLKPRFARGCDVRIHIALRVDDGSDAVGPRRYDACTSSRVKTV